MQKFPIKQHRAFASKVTNAQKPLQLTTTTAYNDIRYAPDLKKYIFMLMFFDKKKKLKQPSPNASVSPKRSSDCCAFNKTSLINSVQIRESAAKLLTENQVCTSYLHVSTGKTIMLWHEKRI